MKRKRRFVDVMLARGLDDEVSTAPPGPVLLQPALVLVWARPDEEGVSL